MKDHSFKRTPLAQGIALVLGVSSLTSAIAQDRDEVLEEVVVTGIRGSLTSSMNMKRNGQGVVDGIAAEDIGKFPDTNLAESLQRISGVSIDRSALGEGQRVTVRGVGPDFNLVLLNGRQMPATRIEETTASNSRAFDFANLASEAISAVEVYKTSRASIPTGGIGATVNIVTARPLERPSVISIGAKGVFDDSTEEGDTVTPEISGIYSDTFADGKFGVALTGSYQDRNLGFNQAAVPNGWRPFQGDEVNWGTIPLPGSPGSESITNRPDADEIYSVPQNLLYSFNEVQRERTNGQLTLQFRPVEALTATLDYTYSENVISTQRNELSVWFNYGPSVSSWTDGPVAAPVIYAETIDPATSDLSMGGAQYASVSENNSLGFNLRWDVSDRLGFSLDYHDSDGTDGPDSPYGSNAVLGAAGFFRGTTAVDFSGDFPIMMVQLPAGQTAIDPAQMVTTGRSFRNSYMKSEVEQLDLSGDFVFADESSLDFGVTLTDVHNRSAFANVQTDSWGGFGTPDDYPDDAWIPTAVSPHFDNMPGSGDPRIFPDYFEWDFDRIRDAAIAVAGSDASFLATDDYSTDRRTREESTSAYLQYNRSFDVGDMPANIALGVRYEETDVTSSALVPTATGILWVANNEFSVQFEGTDFTTLDGSYDYVLPSMDFDIEPVDNVIARVSYSQTIGRPGWGDIQGGQTIDQLIRIDGGLGRQGDPGLKPLESENIDLSLEWYYDDSSYLSVGYFHKDIDNYVGVSTIEDTPFDLAHPGQGARYQEALAAVGPDLTDIRNYIFENYGDTPEVTITGTDSNGNFTGTIAGIPGEDPVASFDITVPANQRSATLDGWEIALQHVFGDSGFGVSTNVTFVDSDLAYDDSDVGEQFALEGLSDSANFIGFYEKYGWGVRVAYNWRDEFLTQRFDGTGLPNPVYTEDYGQWDVNVNYDWTDHLTVFAEGINITDEVQRLHGRHPNELLFITQTGPRYMIGARYSFR